ncbi:MAG: acyltransferase [Actinomycetes bacterium]
MNQFIRQLTGVRFIAAAWVVLYHFQAALGKSGLLVPGLHDVLRVGRLGVDLFFCLSGFILTHTYLNKLGPKFSIRGSLHFYGLRLARVYPVHFVMLNIAGVVTLSYSIIGGKGGALPGWFNVGDYFKQVFLVQEWAAHPTRGWNFTAWSLSMEWLAYLLFPVLVIVLFRLGKRAATKWLVLLWIVAISPVVLFGILHRGDAYYIDNFGSTLRILTEFTTGSITYLIVRRLAPDERGPKRRVERLATTLSVVLPVAVLGFSFVLNHVPTLQWSDPNFPPRMHLALAPLLAMWIGALALSRHGLAKWLASDRLVLGGFISFSLYMTHIVLLQVFNVVTGKIHITHGPIFAVLTVLAIASSVPVAWLMWRFVEEPSRERIRDLLGDPPKPLGDAVPSH